MDTKELVRLALESGATKAEIISGSQIVTSESFRDICRDGGCGAYGRCWMCPPDIGDVHELMAKLREWDRGLLYQTIGEVEDSFDIEGMGEAAVRHAQVSQAVEAAMRPVLEKHLHLSCGGCRLCPRCSKLDNEPCRHPDKALPPMEGYGIDVYQTSKTTSLKYINGQNTVTFFGLVLF